MDMNSSESDHGMFSFEECIDNFGRTYFIVKTFSSNAMVLNQILVCVATAVAIIPSVLLNIITFLTIYQSKKLRRRLLYYLILIQSCIDLVCGAVSMPLHLYVKVKELHGTLNCLFYSYGIRIMYAVGCFSIIALSAINFERYMSVFHPFIHRTRLSKRKFVIYIIVMGIAFTFFSVAHEIRREFFGVIAILTLGTFLFSVAFWNTRILIAGYRFAKTLNGLPTRQDQERPSGRERKVLRKELILAKSCLLVVISTLLCYLPFPVILVVYFKDVSRYKAYNSWGVLVAMLSSCFNSIIFFWRTKILRQEAIKTLTKIFYH